MGNIFRDLRALGYQNLLPLRPGTKSPYLPNWQNHIATESDLDAWGAQPNGVGLRCGDGLVVLDIDAYDATTAEAIEQDARKLLGDTPRRVGRWPKRALLYRITEDVPSESMAFGEAREDGKRNAVEIVGQKRQVVIHGVHPDTGKPYEWEGGIPRREAVPEITPQMLARFMDIQRAKLPMADGAKRRSVSPADAEALKGDIAVVRKAMLALPNDARFANREYWVKVAHAVRGATQDDPEAGFDIFEEWSARWAGDKTDDAERKLWDSIDPAELHVGARWIYEQAEQLGGGAFSTAEAWFEPITEDQNPFAQISLNAFQGSEEGAGVYRVLGVDEIVNRPPPRWLVARHIPEVGLGFLYSRPGAGKSFLALDMALHIAAGDADWHGDAIAPEAAGVVLYIAAEGSYGFRNRVRAWRKERGDRDLSRFQMIEQTINFMAPEEIGKLMRTVREVLKAPPCLIVVDTVSRALPGADENGQQEMTIFAAMCGKLREAFGGVVLGVHHSNKAGDMRGSTVLPGAADFIFRLERKEGATIGQLKCEKQKDGPDGWTDSYRFDLVQVGEGESSLVPTREGSGAGFGPDLVVSGVVTAGVFEAMRKAWEAGKPWSKKPQARGRYAITLMCDGWGFKAGQAEETLRTWEAAGLISEGEADKKTHARGYYISDLSGAAGHIVQSENVFD